MCLLATLHFNPAPATERAGKIQTCLGWAVVPLWPVLCAPWQWHSSAGMSGGAWRSTRHPSRAQLPLQVGRNSSQGQHWVWAPQCRSGMLLDKHSLHKSFCLGVFVSSLGKTNVDVGPDFSRKPIHIRSLQFAFISSAAPLHILQNPLSITKPTEPKNYLEQAVPEC